MFKKLRRTLTLICTGGTVLVLVLMSLSSLRGPEQQLREQARDAFQSNLGAVVGRLQGGNVVDHAWLTRTETADNLLVHIRTAGGRSLKYGEDIPLRAELAALAYEQALTDYGFAAGEGEAGALTADWVVFTLEHPSGDYHAGVCTVPAGAGFIAVAVLKPTTAEDAQILRLRVTSGLYVAIAAAALFLFSWLFTGWAIRPVEENRKRQTQFVSAASHEIRSPLAVIQASAQAIERATPEQAAAFARNISGECERLSSLAGDLLMLAGAESRTWSMRFADVEPETLLLSVSERYEPVAAQKSIRIDAVLPDDPLPQVSCDAGRVDQLLTILMDNAVRYTPRSGRVRLQAGCNRRWVWLCVADSGPGVPDEQKPYVFDRFYRGDNSRTDREHYGLGLSIAKEIAELHKGSLRVGDADEGGALFTLTLPR